MDEGFGMKKFKFLKYETRNEKEKRKIEDTIMTKLGKWKYSPNEFSQQIPNKIIYCDIIFNLSKTKVSEVLPSFFRI